MLSDRQKQILQVVIEEYINTAEPVSSAILVNKYGLDYSSATIRNDMADLEKEGYLEKTHTSSGRIPSAKGYRFYVDELLNDEKIGLDEIQYIKTKLETKVNEIEDLTKITTNTLSEITHYTTVAIGPEASNNLIKDIKFEHFQLHIPDEEGNAHFDITEEYLQMLKILVIFAAEFVVLAWIQ